MRASMLYPTLKQCCYNSGQRRCKRGFAGNTMTQHAPDGSLLFLHANLSPKWTLQVPGDFSAYMHRRAHTSKAKAASLQCSTCMRGSQSRCS